MQHIWQITSKRGETNRDDGKWLAQESVDGHLVGPVFGPYLTKEEAEQAGGKK